MIKYSQVLHMLKVLSDLVNLVRRAEIVVTVRQLLQVWGAVRVLVESTQGRSHQVARLDQHHLLPAQLLGSQLLGERVCLLQVVQTWGWRFLAVDQVNLL